MEQVDGYFFRQNKVNKIMKYKTELINSMNYLSKKSDTIFLGQ